jgi:hypothetical protein
MNYDREEQVRARAYERWEGEGRPDGRDTAHWFDAEREMRTQDEDSLQQGISNRPASEETESQHHLPRRGSRKEDEHSGVEKPDAA